MKILVSVVAVFFASMGVAQAAPDTTPPVATITPSSVLRSVQIVTFNEPVKAVSTDNVVLQIAEPAQTVTASLTCTDIANATVPCLTGEVRAVNVRPAPILIPGQTYTIVVNPSGPLPVTDDSGNAAATTTKTFQASIAEQETSPAATYAWPGYSNAAAYGTSYRTEHTSWAIATFTFTGPSLTWYTRAGPNEGKASVSIDRISKGIVNNYSPVVKFRYARHFNDLGNGAHRIVIRVRGEKGSAHGTGTWVTVDAFRIGSGALSPDDATYLWAGVGARGPSGQHYVRANAARATAAFAFSGRGIDWFTDVGPDRGKADVAVDGTLIRTYDNYYPVVRYAVRHTILGFAAGVHTLTITVRSDRNAKSRGTWIGVDRWVLRAGVTDFRRLGAWIDRYDYSSSRATIDGMLDGMKSHHVQTLYLETATYTSSSAFIYPTQVDWWIDDAHARGITVIGWYLPGYSEHLQTDIARTAVIAARTTPSGQHFDGLGIDIETCSTHCTNSEWMSGIATHLKYVRARVGLTFPVAAITFAPLDMDILPKKWANFPWSAIGKYADVEMPMSYWANRTDRCANGQLQYCTYEYTRQNIVRSRSYTNLPVHVIGGVANRVTQAGVADFVRGAIDTKAFGGSIYDYRTTQPHPGYWTELEKLNLL